MDISSDIRNNMPVPMRKKLCRILGVVFSKKARIFCTGYYLFKATRVSNL